MNAFQATVSTYHLRMKFSTSEGIGEVRGDQHVARAYYMVALQGETLKEAPPPKELDVWDELTEQQGKLVEDLI